VNYVQKGKYMTHNIGLILLATFLILFSLLTFGLAIPAIILGVVAIVSGVFILIGK